ncbi:hypothetical protein ACLFMI_09320 [Pseudonocardia nantongensis]|uniref:hypothetical protein n=1 Tax=Pseudonocardia nantongensis TaxID=1181885 RepID=UPI00397A0CF2
MIFTPTVLSPEEERLRREVREFLVAELPPDFRPAWAWVAGTTRSSPAPSPPGVGSG